MSHFLLKIGNTFPKKWDRDGAVEEILLRQTSPTKVRRVNNRALARQVHDGDVSRVVVHVPVELAETAQREEHGGGQVGGPGGEGRGYVLVALNVILRKGRHRRPRELGEARWEARGLPAGPGV